MSGWQNDRRIEDYLDAVCAEIRWSETHPEIRQELASHIADRTEAALEASVSEGDALVQALRQMGDPALVGRQLDQAHRPRIDWALVAATLLLVLLGLWAMYAVDASDASPVEAGLLPKKLVWSGIGLAVATGLMLCDYRRLRRFAWPLLGVTVIGLIYAGEAHLRYKGYVHLLDLAPLLLAPALAGIFAEWRWTAPWARLKAAVLFAIPTVALAWSASIFAAFEYGVVFGAVALGTRPSWRQVQPVAYTALAVGGLLLTATLREPYRRNRLLGWANRYADPQGAGYLPMQAVKALRGAGAWGHGATAPFPPCRRSTRTSSSRTWSTRSGGLREPPSASCCSPLCSAWRSWSGASAIPSAHYWCEGRSCSSSCRSAGTSS
jgi:rod shape determining protein RodA